MEIFKNTNFKSKDKQNERVSDFFFKMKQNDIKTYMKLINIIRTGFLNKNV